MQTDDEPAVPADHEPVADSGPPPVAPVGRGRSPRDMALSMLVLLVPIALVVGLYRFLGHETPPVVDPAPAYASARAAHEFDVLEAPLPTGWQIQLAQYRREQGAGVLRLGVRSPDGGAMQLVESAAPAPALITRELGDGPRDEGTVEVDGRSWTRYAGANAGERALVLAESSRTVIVYGRTSAGALADFASRLR